MQQKCNKKRNKIETARMKYLYSIALLCLLLIISCNKPIHIISDNPEIALIAEAYNNKVKKPLVIVHDIENITTLTQNKKLDFIITDPIDTKYNNFFSSIDFEKIHIPSIHIKHTYNNMALLSFSFPFIAIRKDMDENPYNSKRISLQMLQIIAKTNTTKKDADNLYYLGFYPIDNSFYDVFSSPTQKQNWLIESGLDSKEIETYYKKHYNSVPLISRLLDKNIQYKYISSQRFYAMPHTIQDMFNIYLLENETNTINIVSNVYIGYISSGIVRKSRTKHFYKWLFSYEGQQEIIALQRKQNPYTPSFIDNSFSSVWETNTKILFQNNAWIYQNQPLYTQINP